MNLTPAVISSILFEKEPVSIKIEGDSMYPYFKNGQLISIRSIQSSILQIGRCCVYQSNTNLVIHRLLWISRNWAYFAGDASTLTEKIEKKNVIGEPILKENFILWLLIIVINSIFLLFKKIPFIFSIRPKIFKFIFKIEELYEKVV